MRVNHEREIEEVKETMRREMRQILNEVMGIELEKKMEEIKTTMEIGQEAVNGAIEMLGEEVRAAVTVPITKKDIIHQGAK